MPSPIFRDEEFYSYIGGNGEEPAGAPLNRWEEWMLWLASTLQSAKMPTGGTAGQFLVKQSSTDYDAAWTTVPDANGQEF